MELIISDPIRKAAPGFKALVVEADVQNAPTHEELSCEIKRLAEQIRELVPIDQVNKRPAIAATRTAYKSCGKDPNRYRPSSEALMRRCVRGMELYTIDALVDLVNLASLRSGYSIGGFDADKIEGNTLTLGIGEKDEPYLAIGRGELNIEGLPVWRDAVGGIGTPTSDNDRTKMDLNTKRVLFIVNIYGEEMPIAETASMISALLQTYASATNIQTKVVS